jgi:hypothetical protein
VILVGFFALDPGYNAPKTFAVSVSSSGRKRRMPRFTEIKAEVLNPQLLPYQALELVYGECPNQDNNGDIGQLTNCALMAEFSLRRWGGWSRQEFQRAVMAQNPLTLSRTANAIPKPFVNEDSLLVELPGHNIALFRDEATKLWSGVHSWDSKFHLFAQLNTPRHDYNAWNMTSSDIVAWLRYVGEAWGGMSTVADKIQMRPRFLRTT